MPVGLEAETGAMGVRIVGNECSPRTGNNLPGVPGLPLQLGHPGSRYSAHLDMKNKPESHFACPNMGSGFRSFQANQSHMQRLLNLAGSEIKLLCIIEQINKPKHDKPSVDNHQIR